MDPAAFTNQKTGQLVPIPEGGVAFVPDFLPPNLGPLSNRVLGALERATMQVGRLGGQATDFVHPEVLVAPFLRREAVLSSRIEGTQTSYSDLLLYEAAAETQQQDGDAREVSNYVAALNYGLARAKEISIGKHLICETHKILMTGTSEEKRSGAFRAEQVYIGPRGLPISESRFVPPPVVHVESLFDNLINYINSDESLPRLIRLAIIHYQFESIHPFYDGNGRIGRLIMPLLLTHFGLISPPMLYLSAYFERRRAHYNDGMFNVSADGQWDGWLTFFLEAVAAQALDSGLRMRQLQDLRAFYWSKINKARNAAALLKLLDALFEIPVMTNPRARAILKQSNQSSSDAVTRLVEAGVIEPLAGNGRRRKLFFSRAIFEIIDRAESVPPAVEESGGIAPR